MARRERALGRMSRGVGPGRERGTALVEFALILPLLALLCLGVLDLGRAAQLQNRLSNASREGAAVAQFRPTAVDCTAGSIIGGVRAEDPDLATTEGFAVTVTHDDGTTAVAYTGCGTTSPPRTIEPGDRVIVTAAADFRLISPMISILTGNPLRIARSTEVVIQG
jgi:Flp pilus assembly protein TadG